jgi:cytochrome c-type biogenesis protein
MFDALPHTSLMAAFLAGLLSVWSPWALPVIPSYLTSVIGLSVTRSMGVEGSDRLKTTITMNSLLFLSGVSILLIGFGMSTTGIGHMLMDHQVWIRQSGAMLIMLIGLYVMMEWVTPRWRMEGKGSARKAGEIRYVGSFLIGVAFAAGWTPCVGPVLGTMLHYAGTPGTVVDGITLLIFFSGGLGMPLVGLSFALNRVFSCPRRRHLYGGFVSGLSGLCLVILGGVLYSDRLGSITGVLSSL